MSDFRIPYCGENCCFRGPECMDGFGYCEIIGHSTLCSDQCWIDHTRIKPRETIKALHYFQKWRRGAKIAMPHPYVIGKVIDAAISQLRDKKRYG